MTKTNQASGKVLPFVVPEPSMEASLEKWFRGVIRSNQDLITALERLVRSYKGRLGTQPLTEADRAILLAVEITLNNARSAQTL